MRLNPGGRLGYIFIIDIDGQNLRQLTGDDFLADKPVWSPNGQYLTFYGEGLNGESKGIYMMDISGGSLTFLASSDGSLPNWLLDGSQIIFVPGPAGAFVQKVTVFSGERQAGYLITIRLIQNFPL